MALGRSGSRSKSFVPPKLMITSLMDMFTIILIFLLFSFSDNPEKMQLDDKLDLPYSSAKDGYSDAVKIILTKDSLRIEDEVVGTVEDERIIGLDPDNLKASTLFARLKTKKEALAGDVEEQAQEDEEKKKETNHILFLCDKSHAFNTINTVIKAAGLAGYPNFQFAVLEEKK